jgi:hypothetical protein
VCSDDITPADSRSTEDNCTLVAVHQLIVVTSEGSNVQ